MIRHLCDNQDTCKKCKRNKRLRLRYQTDVAYKQTVVQRNATALNLRYQNDPIFRETVKQKSRDRSRATYVPKPRTPKPCTPRKDGNEKHTRYHPGGIRRIYWEMAVGLLAERDGWLCQICKAPVTWETVSIDHIISRHIKEDHSPKNIQLAHRTCNFKKR